VLAVLRSILADQAGLVAGIEDSTEVEQILGMVANWRERLRTEDEARAALSELIKQVQLTEAGLRVTVNIPIAAVGAGANDRISLSHFVPMRMKRRGVEMRLILDGNADQQGPVDPALLKALARARSWFEEVATGRVASLAAIGRREGLRKRYVTRLTKLAFIAPSIAEGIAEGRAPMGVNLQMLMDGRVALALCWTEQQRMFDGH
jgi:site-specific DNA recombinase